MVFRKIALGLELILQYFIYDIQITKTKYTLAWASKLKSYIVYIKFDSLISTTENKNVCALLWVR